MARRERKDDAETAFGIHRNMIRVSLTHKYTQRHLGLQPGEVHFSRSYQTSLLLVFCHLALSLGGGSATDRGDSEVIFFLELKSSLSLKL